MRVVIDVKPGQWVSTAKPTEDGDFFVKYRKSSGTAMLHFTTEHGWNTHEYSVDHAMPDDDIEAWMIPPVYDPDAAI